MVQTTERVVRTSKQSVDIYAECTDNKTDCPDTQIISLYRQEINQTTKQTQDSQTVLGQSDST